MLTFFLFLLYLIAGTLTLHAMIRRIHIGFSLWHTAAAVVFKVMLGCLYGYIFLHYYGGDDTWNYFWDSRVQTDVLLHDPQKFIVIEASAHQPGSWTDMIWQNLLSTIKHFEYSFMVSLLGIFNLFSGKNYYIDLLLFDLVAMSGPLLLFKMLVRRFPTRAGLFYLLVFFIPSITFWCSGIRAEALILFFVVLAIYNGMAYAQKPGWRRGIGLLLALTGFLLFRYQYLAFFLPALLAFMISVAKKQTGPVFFNRVYLAAGLLFLASLFLPPAQQLSAPMIRSQQSFFVLHGNTRYRLDSLQPGVLSLLRVFPQALANSTLRPYPWEAKSALQFLSSLECLFLFGGLLFFFSGKSGYPRVADPLLWLFLYYAFTQLIAIGYSVPFPGAIVRYRCIPFLLLFISFFSVNDLLQQKITRRLFKNIIN